MNLIGRETSDPGSNVPPSTDAAQAPLALVCAVPLEADLLTEAMQDAAPLEIGRKPAVRGLLDGVSVLVLFGGMGKTNAAQALTALLERQRVRGVINFGVGGAYPGSGLRTGDVALASAEIYGDDGVETPVGWISTEEIGIPLLDRQAEPRYNRFPLAPQRVDHARITLERAGLPVRIGPFVTLSCCSGTTARGRELAYRFGAACESMEGAAFAHVAEIYGVPFLEVRGISNAVEDRDLSRWRLREAAAAAATAARVLVREWRD